MIQVGGSDNYSLKENENETLKLDIGSRVGLSLKGGYSFASTYLLV